MRMKEQNYIWEGVVVIDKICKISLLLQVNETLFVDKINGFLPLLHSLCSLERNACTLCLLHRIILTHL
jgi:hypothetical protein